MGPTRFETAALVAEAFFDAPVVAGLARSHAFPDALTGGVHVGRQGGPMLLTASADLHPAPRGFLQARAGTLDAVRLYGCTAALSDQVHTQAATAID